MMDQRRRRQQLLIEKDYTRCALSRLLPRGFELRNQAAAATALTLVSSGRFLIPAARFDALCELIKAHFSKSGNAK